MQDTNLIRVKVDEYGIDVDAIEKICKRKKIKALYITSHHHYPTTVTLTASTAYQAFITGRKIWFYYYRR